jgi:hypothetical protein
VGRHIDDGATVDDEQRPLATRRKFDYVGSVYCAGEFN